MEEKFKVYVRGVNDRGNEVIETLENFGGQGTARTTRGKDPSATCRRMLMYDHQNG